MKYGIRKTGLLFPNDYTVGEYLAGDILVESEELGHQVLKDFNANRHLVSEIKENCDRATSLLHSGLISQVQLIETERQTNGIQKHSTKSTI